MCTALTLTTINGEHLFGRNMDLEYSFGQSPIIVPRNFEYINKATNSNEKTKYALIGMATVTSNHPLFAEALNEVGLACAGLNFPKAYWEKNNIEGKYNLPPYDFIPWVTSNFKTIEEAMPHLKNINLVGIPFNENIQLPTLHWMIADSTGKSIVVEATEEGINIYDNPIGVLTNAPSFPWHLNNLCLYRGITTHEATNVKWGDLELPSYSTATSTIGLPGDYSSPSRFVKTAFLRSNSIFEKTEYSGIVEFFHILDNVSMVRGATYTKSGIPEITQYTSCMCQEKGLYYYKSYNNHRINVINMHNEDLNSNELKVFPYRDTEDIYFEN